MQVFPVIIKLYFQRDKTHSILENHCGKKEAIMQPMKLL